MFGALNLLTALACAQLIPLEEKDMGEVTAGVGLALNDVMFIGAPNASIQLTFDTDIGADGGFVDHIAIHGGRNAFSSETSYNTCLESPSIVNCEGATVGDLSNLSAVANRINFNVATEANTNYIDLAWPTNNAADDTGIDIQFRLVTFGEVSPDDTPRPYADGFFADITWWRLQNIKLTGSAVRLWGSRELSSSVKEVDPLTGVPSTTNYNGGKPVGLGFAGLVNATLDIAASVANSDAIREDEPYKKFPGGGTANDTYGTGPHGRGGVILANGITVSNLGLGFFPYMPLSFGSIDDPTPGEAPNFYIEVPSLPNDPTITAAFYNRTQHPKANISIQQLALGNNASNTDFFFLGDASGAQKAMNIQGLNIQHLRIQTCGNGGAGC